MDTIPNLQEIKALDEATMILYREEEAKRELRELAIIEKELGIVF